MGGGVGGEGDDDDIVMQTPRTTSLEEPVYSVLQYFRDVGPSHIVTNCTLNFANSTLGFAMAFGENSKLVGGVFFFARYLKYFGHVVVHC